MLEIISRLQFAATITFHFLFVPLTIGLILIIAIYETKYFRTKDDSYRKLSDYFTNVFIVNYAIGIVTGIAMSVQFGTNWGEYSKFMGDVFGTPLALEALLAFFLESTFTGILVFRRHKMSPKFRLITVWLITLGTSISALWILTANAFMQNPVGFQLATGGSSVELTSITELIFNPYVGYMLVHTLTASYLLGGFFILSVSSYKFLKLKTEKENEETTEERIEEIINEEQIFFKAGKIGAIVALITSFLMPIIGNFYFEFISIINPAKTNAILGNYQEYVNELNLINSNVTPMSESLLMTVNISFIIMVSLGTLFILISIYTLIYYKKFTESSSLHKIYKWLFITPYIAIIAGWFTAEIGRQPWIVYGLMETKNGISEVPASEVVFSLIMISIFSLVLLIVVWVLSKNQVNKSPNSMEYYGYESEES